MLELLVVILIIGITMTFITLSIDTRSEEIENEARRLAALVNLAQEEAILNSKEIAIQFDATGYDFYRLDGAQWQKIGDDDVLRTRSFPSEVSVEMDLDGESAAPTQASDFSDENRVPPRIYLLSSGESTSYKIRYSDKHSDTHFLITADATGRAVVIKEGNQ